MNDLSKKIRVVEERVRALVAENHSLRTGIEELRIELEKARTDSQLAEAVRGKHQHLRERIERVLASLDSLEHKE